MKQYERFLIALSLLCVFIVATGVNRCQEDYDFAKDAKVSEDDEGTITATATPTGTIRTPTPTPGDDETITPDPDEPTPTPISTSTPTPGTAIPPNRGDRGSNEGGDDFIGALALLGEKDDGKSESGKSGSGNSGSKQLEQSGGTQNWLGRTYSEDPAAYLDSDLDGFSDDAEVTGGSDPQNIDSMPEITINTSLQNRMIGYDDDMDGLPNTEEAALGTDGGNADSDGDGASDGAEMRSGTNLLDAESKPSDSDRDGLSDKYERARGLNPLDQDSDKDGLRDDIEYAIGVNPMAPDTDTDGIFDGKEYAIGSDPNQSERAPTAQ